MMAIEAAEDGHFTTMAVVAPASKLRINAVTKRAGEIKIEAADLHGRPIAGRTFAQSTPIVGDAFRQPVKWGESDDLGVKAGEPVVLRFKMSGAKIYGLDFE